MRRSQILLDSAAYSFVQKRELHLNKRRSRRARHRVIGVALRLSASAKVEDRIKS